jgi:hypothetical protein
MYSLDPLKQISINSTDKGGQTLKIPYVPAGTTLNVFATPAGTYCVAEYYFQFIRITLNDQKHGVCFDVIPGKIAYSGNITPSADSPNDIETYQTYDWKGFEAKLKSEYPTLAAQYPIVKP